jgi:iron-sulfur cluster assembly protein
MSENNLVQLTDKAIDEVRRIFSSDKSNADKGLRLAVIGGGCSGLQYKIEFSDKKEKDNTLKYEGFEVIMDPKSSIYLRGIVLDFKDGLNGKGFVFENPNAKNTCGCGESFSV